MFPDKFYLRWGLISLHWCLTSILPLTFVYAFFYGYTRFSGLDTVNTFIHNYVHALETYFPVDKDIVNTIPIPVIDSTEIYSYPLIPFTNVLVKSCIIFSHYFGLLSSFLHLIPTSFIINTVPIIIHYYSLLEIAFYTVFLITRRKLTASRGSHDKERLVSHTERTEWLIKVLNDIEDLQDFLGGWFLDSQTGVCLGRNRYALVHKENMKQWLAWAFYGMELASEAIHVPGVEAELDEMVELIERIHSHTFRDGMNKDIRSIRLLIDPVYAYYKPIFFYLIISCVDMSRHIPLRLAGFRYQVKHISKFRVDYVATSDNSDTASTPPPQPTSNSNNVPLTRSRSLSRRRSVAFQAKSSHPPREGVLQLNYWLYEPTTPSRTRKVPLVFIHGLGVGLIAYIGFIQKLRKQCPDRAIFLVELPFVSMKFESNIPSIQETVDQLGAMLIRHQYSKATFIGHSLGSIYVTWMLNRCPERVASVALLDPVCFRVYYPTLAYNFIHAPATKASELLIRHIIAKDLFISNFISRNFHWYRNILDVPAIDEEFKQRRMKVILSGRDSLVDTKMLVSYLSNAGVPRENLLVFWELEHAEILIRDSIENEIVDAIDLVAKDSDRDVFYEQDDEEILTEFGTPTSVKRFDSACSLEGEDGCGCSKKERRFGLKKRNSISKRKVNA